MQIKPYRCPTLQTFGWQMFLLPLTAALIHCLWECDLAQVTGKAIWPNPVKLKVGSGRTSTGGSEAPCTDTPGGRRQVRECS